MKEISLTGTARKEVGKRSTKAVRAAGNVPCILYGESEALPFEVASKDLDKVVFTPHIYVVNITIDGVPHQAVLKEVQFHAVKDTVLHADFYEVIPGKEIEIEIPIAPTGLAEGVRAGGKLITMVRKLKVKAPWEKIPEKLVFDVTNLALAQSIKVGDLSFDGLELVAPKELIVCAVKMTRAAIGAAAAAAKA